MDRSTERSAMTEYSPTEEQLAGDWVKFKRSTLEEKILGIMEKMELTSTQKAEHLNPLYLQLEDLNYSKNLLETGDRTLIQALAENETARQRALEKARKLHQSLHPNSE